MKHLYAILTIVVGIAASGTSSALGPGDRACTEQAMARMPLGVARALRAVAAPPPLARTVVLPATTQAWPATSEQAAVTFARAYGGAGADTGYVVATSPDGSFYLAGETESFGAGGRDFWLMRFDSGGGILWQRTYGTAASEFAEPLWVEGSGFMIGFWTIGAAGAAPFTIVRLSEAGAIQWQRSYGTADDTFSAAFAISGGYLLTGSRMDLQTSKMVHEIVKIDANGAIVWQRLYRSAASHGGFLQQLSDGSIIGWGTRLDLSSGDTDAYLAKLGATGVIQWQRTYGGDHADFASAATQTADGCFLISGTTRSWGVNAASDDSSDLWLLKLDSGGNPQWGYAYGGPGDEAGLALPAEGGFSVTGVTGSFGAGGDDVFLAALSGTGSFLWGKTYGGSADETGFAFPEFSGGGYLAQASTASFGAGGEDVWLLKLDASGNIAWQHTYGGGSTDTGFPTRLPDGGLLLTGDTRSWGAGDADAWAIKLDSTGALAAPPLGGIAAEAACALVGTTAVQPAPFAFTVTAALPVAGTDDFVAGPAAYSSGTSAIVSGISAVTVTDLCSAQQNLAAAAGADTTSGEAPLAVSFTGSATGGTPPYAWEWSFGDGSPHSSQQSPSHTYAGAGAFPVTLTVTDAAAHTASDAHLTITVAPRQEHVRRHLRRHGPG